MLRQIAGTEQLGPLATLGKIASPEGVGTREQLNHHGTPSTQQLPLVKLVDAVVPDPPFRRQFAAQVNTTLNDAPKFASGAAELGKIFQAWHDMGGGFAALSANAPVLASASSRIFQLEKIGSGGLEALQYLQSGKSAPDNWKDTQLALIKQAETADVSLLKLPWMHSYRVLVLAASSVSQLEKTDRKEWIRKVLEEAAEQEPKQKYTW